MVVAFEYWRIVERDGGLTNTAQPNGRAPTELLLIAASDTPATFENPTDDFPKMIRYTLRADEKLEARVSEGGERGESFVSTRRAGYARKSPVRPPEPGSVPLQPAEACLRVLDPLALHVAVAPQI